MKSAKFYKVTVYIQYERDSAKKIDTFDVMAGSSKAAVAQIKKEIIRSLAFKVKEDL